MGKEALKPNKNKKEGIIAKNESLEKREEFTNLTDRERAFLMMYQKEIQELFKMEEILWHQ